jgi:hypothetical protein
MPVMTKITHAKQDSEDSISDKLETNDVRHLTVTEEVSEDSSQLACGRQNCEATTCLNENTGGMTSCTLTADDENLSLVCGITADSATTTVEGPDQMEGNGQKCEDHESAGNESVEAVSHVLPGMVAEEVVSSNSGRQECEFRTEFNHLLKKEIVSQKHLKRLEAEESDTAIDGTTVETVNCDTRGKGVEECWSLEGERRRRIETVGDMQSKSTDDGVLRGEMRESECNVSDELGTVGAGRQVVTEEVSEDSSQLACGRQNCEATTCLNENTGGMTSCTLTADDENLSLVCGITADSATTTVEGPDQMEGNGQKCEDHESAGNESVEAVSHVLPGMVAEEVVSSNSGRQECEFRTEFNHLLKKEIVSQKHLKRLEAEESDTAIDGTTVETVNCDTRGKGVEECWSLGG